jgi:uncharacterized membrane protein
MLSLFHHFLEVIVEYAIFGFEIVGVFILIWAGIKGVINFLKRDPQTGLKLGEGMALALQFKLGGEILRTVIISEVSEIFLVGGIIILRVALTLLIHWEIKNSKHGH